jgi:hypothetical protein
MKRRHLCISRVKAHNFYTAEQAKTEHEKTLLGADKSPAVRNQRDFKNDDSSYQSLNVLPVAHAGQLFRYFLTCRPGKRLGSLQKQLMEYRYRYIKKNINCHIVRSAYPLPFKNLNFPPEKLLKQNKIKIWQNAK